MAFLPKSPKMDHKKWYTLLGNGYFTQQIFCYPKIQKWITKKSIHFWEIVFTPKSKNGSQKNSIHFWEMTLLPQKSKNGSRKIVYTSRLHFRNLFFTYLSIFPSYPIIAFHPIIAFFIFVC